MAPAPQGHLLPLPDSFPQIQLWDMSKEDSLDPVLVITDGVEGEVSCTCSTHEVRAGTASRHVLATSLSRQYIPIQLNAVADVHAVDGMPLVLSSVQVLELAWDSNSRLLATATNKEAFIW